MREGGREGGEATAAALEKRERDEGPVPSMDSSSVAARLVGETGQNERDAASQREGVAASARARSSTLVRRPLERAGWGETDQQQLVVSGEAAAEQTGGAEDAWERERKEASGYLPRTIGRVGRKKKRLREKRKKKNKENLKKRKATKIGKNRMKNERKIMRGDRKKKRKKVGEKIW